LTGDYDVCGCMLLFAAVVQHALRYDHAEQLFRCRRRTHASLTTAFLPFYSSWFWRSVTRSAALVFGRKSCRRRWSYWRVYSGSKHTLLWSRLWDADRLQQTRRLTAAISGLMTLHVLATDVIRCTGFAFAQSRVKHALRTTIWYVTLVRQTLLSVHHV